MFRSCFSSQSATITTTTTTITASFAIAASTVAFLASTSSDIKNLFSFNFRSILLNYHKHCSYLLYAIRKRLWGVFLQLPSLPEYLTLFSKESLNLQLIFAYLDCLVSFILARNHFNSSHCLLATSCPCFSSEFNSPFILGVSPRLKMKKLFRPITVALRFVFWLSYILYVYVSLNKYHLLIHGVCL